MKSKYLKGIFLLSIITLLIIGKARQTQEVTTQLLLDNIEALASSSEGPGWRGYYTDWDAGCCRISPISSNECKLSPCSGEY